MRAIVTVIILSATTLPAYGQQCITTSPPKDAIVLVKGDDNSAWKAQDGGRCPWPTKDGVMTVKDSNIMTKREFGDVQLHVEFQIPEREDGGHGHGNSGVYLHGDYEIQVIESFGRKPDAGSSCGAIYGKAAPMVDASLPAGQWQSFDVLFRAPVYDKDKKPVKLARLSIVHNGIWIHDNVECPPTPGGLNNYFQHEGPLWLQNHGHAVNYRNIWVRELKKSEDKPKDR